MKTTKQLLQESQLNVVKLIDIIEKKDIQIEELKSQLELNNQDCEARLNSIKMLQKRNDELEQKYNDVQSKYVNRIHAFVFNDETIREHDLSFKHKELNDTVNKLASLTRLTANDLYNYTKGIQ